MRLELLKVALKKTENIKKLTSDKKQMERLFSDYLGPDGAILPSVDTIPSSSESCDDPPILEGVITELWKTSGAGWKGAVTNNPIKKNGQIIVPARGHLFDWTSPMQVDSQLGTYPLHIGDEVCFSPATSDQSIAPGTLQVTRYNSCLKKDFVERYLEWLLQYRDKPLECLARLLDWPAPWTSTINEQTLYSHLYTEILTIYNICTTSPEVVAVHKDKLGLVALLSGSQFVLDIAKVHSANIYTVEEDSILSMAVGLLCDAVRMKNDNNHLLANTIIEMGQVLVTKQKVDLMNLMQSLIVSLVDAHCVPTAPVEATPQTWHHLPTIPSNEEFQKIIKVFEDSKPKFHLPKVKQAYSSALEYGHTYFSLLRADCYYPLCEKIARLKAGNGKVDDSYYQMTFTELIPSSPKPVLYRFRFKGIIKQAPQEDDPPCLTHGNLLCISLDGKFEKDLVWGTVEMLGKVTCSTTQGKQTKEVSPCTYALQSRINIILFMCVRVY